MRSVIVRIPCLKKVREVSELLISFSVPNKEKTNVDAHKRHLNLKIYFIDVVKGVWIGCFSWIWVTHLLGVLSLRQLQNLPNTGSNRKSGVILNTFLRSPRFTFQLYDQFNRYIKKPLQMCQSEMKSKLKFITVCKYVNVAWNYARLWIYCYNSIIKSVLNAVFESSVFVLFSFHSKLQTVTSAVYIMWDNCVINILLKLF